MDEEIKPLDYDSWEKYLEICKKDEVTPSTKDYIIWRDEQNEEKK